MNWSLNIYIYICFYCSQLNDKLDSLTVQRKFNDTVELVAKNRVWNRIITRLPSGQLSFLLRVGTDYLSTLMNLYRWNYIECTLSSNQSPIIQNIRNCNNIVLDLAGLSNLQMILPLNSRQFSLGKSPFLVQLI